MRGLSMRVLGGFNQYSLLSAVVLLDIYALVFGAWWRVIFAQELRDPLLWSIWAVMSVLFCWNVRPLLDLKLAVIGGAGGLVIEWWGTNTEVWRYFTDQRPPLFIIPAWVVSAVIINRVTELIAPLAARCKAWSALAALYWALLYGFVAWMICFLLPFWNFPSTWIFVAVMLSVPPVQKRPSTDLALFLVGSSAGVFFEYWGTSRHCWTYYTHEVPPAVVVLAHGFAAVAFAHAVRTFDWILGISDSRPRPDARPGGAESPSQG